MDKVTEDIPSVNLEDFNLAYQQLFKIVENIIKASHIIRIGSDNAFTKRYHKFRKIYRSDTMEIHVETIEKLLDHCILNIMANPKNNEDDTWISDNSIIIDLAPERKSDHKLMATGFYLRSKRIQQELNDNINAKCDGIGLTGIALEDHRMELEESCPEIHYPDVLLLKMYQVLRVVAKEPAHIKMLDQRVKHFKQKLGLSDNTPKTAGGQGGFMNMAMSALKSMGMPVPDNANIPDDNQIGQIMKSFIDNDATKNLFNGLLQDFQGSDDIKGTLAKIVQRVEDPQIGEAIERTLGSISQPLLPGGPSATLVEEDIDASQVIEGEETSEVQEPYEDDVNDDED